MAKEFSLGKEERLKSRKLVEELFAYGKSLNAFPIRVSYKFISASNVDDDYLLKIGVTASSRNFKKAVDRNRIKRLLREAYRLQKKELTIGLKERGLKAHVFFMYVDKQLPQYDYVFGAMTKCLKLLIKRAATSENIT